MCCNFVHSTRRRSALMLQFYTLAACLWMEVEKWSFVGLGQGSSLAIGCGQHSQSHLPFLAVRPSVSLCSNLRSPALFYTSSPLQLAPADGACDQSDYGTGRIRVKNQQLFECSRCLLLDACATSSCRARGSNKTPWVRRFWYKKSSGASDSFLCKR